MEGIRGKSCVKRLGCFTGVMAVVLLGLIVSAYIRHKCVTLHSIRWVEVAPNISMLKNRHGTVLIGPGNIELRGGDYPYLAGSVLVDEKVSVFVIDLRDYTVIFESWAKAMERTGIPLGKNVTFYDLQKDGSKLKQLRSNLTKPDD